jgi:hypothetical protein
MLNIYIENTHFYMLQLYFLACILSNYEYIHSSYAQAYLVKKYL